MVDDGASSLQRAIAILVALGSDAVTQRDSVGVIDIARLVGREKSQVSRALKTLADAGLVDRDPETLGYRLGWRLFTLAACAADQHLLAIAPRILRELVGVVGERAHLSVLEGPEALTVLSESPARAIIQAVSWVGRPTPLHSTSSGRALLFDHTDEEVRGLLAEAGLVAVAAPVRDFRGRVVAALNISAPKFRLGHNLDTAGLHVKAAAAHLSRALIRPLPAEQTHSA